MTAQPGVAALPPSAGRFMVVFGGIVVAAVLLYYLFLAVDGWGLADQMASATVTGKEYREAGTTYQTQKVGDRMLTVPHTTPAMYILKLDIDGKGTEGTVDKQLYDDLSVGDRVNVVYQKRRILGRTQVTQVTR